MNLGSLIGYLGLDTKDWDKGLDSAEGGLARFAKRGAVAAAAAGVAIAAAVTGAVVAGMNVEAANDKLAAQLGLSAQESERVGGIAGGLYAKAYGGSLGEVNDAIGAVMSSVSGMATASDADLEKMTAKVLNLAQGFEIDVARASQVAGQMINTGLARDGAHAMDLLTASMQKVPAAVREDLLDAVDEYGPFMQSIGLEGEEAFGLLVKAAEDGMYGIDKTGDALKEFTIRATDMSTASKVGYDALGMSQEDMTRKLLAGGETASGAFNEIVTGLRNIKDPAAQSQAALALFGTPLEDLSVQEIPAFLASLQSAETGLGNVAGAADRFDATLNANAQSGWTSIKRQAELAAVSLGNVFLPAVSGVIAAVAGGLTPALTAAGGFITGTLIPAIQSMAQWMAANQTPITIIAGIIGALLLPHLIRLGVVATVTKVQVVASWVAQQAAAVASSAVSVASTYRMIAAWVAARVAAAASFGQTIAIMALYAAESVANAARATAAWVAAQARTVASLAVTAAGFVAQGAAMAASMAATAARVVAGWVLMGAQAMIQAARMAAAWLIAMGPVGWVIAAVIALVALVIANWDTIVAWTKIAWDAVVGAVVAAWEWIKGVVKGALDLLVSWFMNWTAIGLVIQHWDTLVAATRAAWDWVVSLVTGAWAAITGAVSAAVAAVSGAISAAWAAVQGATAAAWTAITGAIQAAWAAITGAVTAAARTVSDAVSAAWNWVRDTTAAIWAAITGVVSAAWGAITGAVSGAISAVTGAISGGWNSVLSWTQSAWSSIVGTVTGAWGQIGSAIYNGVSAAVTFVSTLPSRILGVLGNLGSLLYNAGKSLIQGFINGVGDMFGSVKSTLGGLTSALTSWKGPPKRDKVLLRGAGQLVIGGFINGLESQYGDVQRSLGAFTRDIAGMQPVVASQMAALANVGAQRSIGVDAPSLALAGAPAGRSTSSDGGHSVTVHGGVTVKIETPLNLTNPRDLRQAGEKIRQVIIGLERETS